MELLDVYNANGEKTGKIVERGDNTYLFDQFVSMLPKEEEV